HEDDVCTEVKNIRFWYSKIDAFPFKTEYITRESSLHAEPCVMTEFADGTRDLQLVYRNHCITGTDKGEMLAIVLRDRYYDFEVTLNYYTYKGVDLISKNAVFSDKCIEPVVVTKMKSGTLYPAHNRPMRLMHMAGRALAEYQKKYTLLNQGRFTIDNTRGNCASHQHVPFFAIDEGDATETAGRVWYGLLHWSGDFRMDFEQSPEGQLIVSAGINDFDTEIVLENGESFETPLFTTGFTSGGYERMSRELYDYQYDYLLPQSKIKNDFPIICNTWYPYLMEVTEEKCLGFIDKARYIGAELFVIDDGWFGRRFDATDGLGDWWVTPEKFPNGLRPIADKAHSCDMKFGLWIEPEMVNEKSDLYKQHPEWVLSFPNREKTKIRNQLVLNLAREDVMEFVWETVDRLISEYDLDYLKWDMNAYITETAPHMKDMRIKYIRNLYEVWRRINEKYPDVLLENCASGGARSDFGMAPYSDRINRSDNSDPVDVLKIHEGFSTYLLPRLAGGAGNVAASPNDMQSRVTPLKYRAILGMTGSMSIGVNLLKATDEEIEQLKSYIAQYKEIRHITHNSYVYRLTSAFENNNTAVWEYLARDGKNAIVFAFANGSNFLDAMPRVRLRGLDSHKLYRITGEEYKHRRPDTGMEAPAERFAHGDSLMNFGLRIDAFGDYDSQGIRIEEV
ncbi:MAG: alpha-galactosidase, partial [Clostridia bacterium]|nr:alpha-galactosidase [Clostridia bacterium]